MEEALIIETINRLKEGGVDYTSIISTLQSAGISEEEAKRIYQKTVQGSATPKTENKIPETENQNQEESIENLEEEVDADDLDSVGITNERVESINNELQTQAQKQEIHENIMTSAIDEHEKQLASVNQKIDEVKKTVTINGFALDPLIQKKLEELSTNVSETLATTKATKDLMEKILEMNRKILTELELKK
jgi:pyruvate dehydrogenase complex dehydrogenase (E1) component